MTDQRTLLPVAVGACSRRHPVATVACYTADHYRSFVDIDRE